MRLAATPSFSIARRLTVRQFVSRGRASTYLSGWGLLKQPDTQETIRATRLNLGKTGRAAVVDPDDSVHLDGSGVVAHADLQGQALSASPRHETRDELGLGFERTFKRQTVERCRLVVSKRWSMAVPIWFWHQLLGARPLPDRDDNRCIVPFANASVDPASHNVSLRRLTLDA